MSLKTGTFYFPYFKNLLGEGLQKVGAGPRRKVIEKPCSLALTSTPRPAEATACSHGIPRATFSTLQCFLVHHRCVPCIFTVSTRSTLPVAWLPLHWPPTAALRVPSSTAGVPGAAQSHGQEEHGDGLWYAISHTGSYRGFQTPSYLSGPSRPNAVHLQTLFSFPHLQEILCQAHIRRCVCALPRCFQ